MTEVLKVDELTVSYDRNGVRLTTVANVSFAVRAGEAYGLVGESGSGKSTIALAIARYLASNGRVEHGAIHVTGQNVYELPEKDLRRLRSDSLGMVYQDPARALNPMMRIGSQLGEILKHGHGVGRAEAKSRSMATLRQVAFSNPTAIAARYPHELSGGQQQRVVIAMALIGNPELLILDEPTTNLDASVEAEVLDLVSDLRHELGISLVLISHNLALVTRVCDRVGVLYSGRIVEQGPVNQLFQSPRHPYTFGLIGSVPREGTHRGTLALAPIPGSPPAIGAHVGGCAFASRCFLVGDDCRHSEPELMTVDSERSSRCFFHEAVPPVPQLRVAGELPDRLARGTGSAGASGSVSPLLKVRDLHKSYAGVRACDNVSLIVGRGEILGLVGESGSGKTTLARCIAGLVDRDSGHLELDGHELKRRVRSRNTDTLRALQMVFQSPDSTLNPSHSVRRILSRAIAKLAGERSVEELAAEVQLDSGHLDVTSAALSGGLKQRVAIGRAFAGTPALVICDEAVSSLDVSVQASVLNLLGRLSSETGVSYLFISHDLAVVRYLADRVAVMYLGQLIELGDAQDVFAPPHHPYTEALLSAVPTMGYAPRPRIRLPGVQIDTGQQSRGCRFHSRCPRKIGIICEEEDPPWRKSPGEHLIRCHIPLDKLADAQEHPPPMQSTV